ncbi:hypothetical protein Glove_284g3 [Diversispora epigaea]|uniref:Uncharacterized protein n=1 Tax=Diversispora epigaea TaxID=1348612 RepID=A0A397I2E2_9GLOM|nr:hypothetical protein Glove_284g3 [Diversispora epigaea]
MSSNNNNNINIAAAAAATSANVMQVAFVDQGGERTSVAAATGAQILPAAVFIEHIKLKDYKNMARNAFAALAKHTKRVADIGDMKPGGLHSLDLKFEGAMKKEELLTLNQHIHDALVPVATFMPKKHVQQARDKLASLVERFAAEMKQIFCNKASQDQGTPLDVATYTPSTAEALLMDNNVRFLTNFIDTLKLKAAAPALTKKRKAGSDGDTIMAYEPAERAQYAIIKPRAPPKKKQKVNPPPKRHRNKSAGGKGKGQRNSRKSSSKPKPNQKAPSPKPKGQGGSKHQGAGPSPSRNLPKGQKNRKRGHQNKKN